MLILHGGRGEGGGGESEGGERWGEWGRVGEGESEGWGEAGETGGGGRREGGEEAKSSAADSRAQGLRPATSVCAAPAPLGTAPRPGLLGTWTTAHKADGGDDMAFECFQTLT